MTHDMLYTIVNFRWVRKVG